MRKIFLAAVFFIVLSVGLFFLPKTAYAACQEPTANPSTFPADFKGPVTITTTDECFNEVDYTVAAHNTGIKPEEKTFNNGQTFTVERNVFVKKKIIRTDGKTIKFDLDLTIPTFESTSGFSTTKRGSIGKDHAGTWTLKICQDSDFCTENTLVTIPITVSGAAPPPVPTDVPKVYMNGNQCVYQTGSEEVSLIFDNLQPGQRYRWWWHGKKTPNEDVITSIDENDPNNHTGEYTIPPEETQKTGIRTFCLDVETEKLQKDVAGRCNLGYPNSITLKFEAAPPVGDTTCSSEGGYQNPKLIDGPPPPCEEGLDKDGKKIETLKTPQLAGEIVTCTRVKTAVGSIGTDPAEFIKSIFSLLLGVAGGIAVILIIISGYKLMASQGNPEKVQGAREMLTSAIVGLLFIIFSFVILQVIGVDILKIPGFSK